MAAKRILVTVSTGKQGGETIKALVSQSNSDTSPNSLEILALTRNPTSASAKSLAESSPLITLIQGDPASSASDIFAKAGKVDALFLLTVPGKDGDEEAQARPMIRAAIENGVGHIVFTSVDRGGEELSEDNPTDIEHFAAKHRIEKYLKEETKGKDSGWTILRPVAFMDNLQPGFPGKMFTALWSTTGTKPLQLIACKDIGKIAATILRDPERYKGRCIGLAGDELNIDQARTAFQNSIGSPLPETWGFVGSVLLLVSGEFGKMFRWFGTDGYGVDIGALRREFPDLMDFAAWVKDHGGFS